MLCGGVAVPAVVGGVVDTEVAIGQGNLGGVAQGVGHTRLDGSRKILFAIEPKATGIHAEESLPVFAQSQGGVHAHKRLQPGVVPCLTGFIGNVALELP